MGEDDLAPSRPGALPVGVPGTPPVTSERLPRPETTAEPPPRLAMGWVAALIIAASCAMVLFHLQPTSTKNSNTASRYATVESLVDHGTWSIDKSRYRFTIDKVKIGKHFFSSKPPMLPTYTAGVYWTLQKATGMTFKKNEATVVQVCGLFTGFLSHLVTALYFFRFARLWFRSETAILASLVAICFGYLGAGFATTINNHSVGAALAIVGFYHAYRAHTLEHARTRDWLLSGFWLGLLPTIDLPSAAFSALVGLYLLLKDWRRTLLLMVPAALPPIALQLYLTYASSGSVIPVYGRGELYRYAGSYWERAGGIDALREPKHVYAFHVLLGHHGLFSMTPVLFFSLVGIAKNLRRRARLLPEALVVGAISVGMIALYIFKTHNYGGWSVGMRWLVPITPLLLLFMGAWLDSFKPRAWKWLLVLLAFSVSAFHAQDAISGPFQYSRWHNLIEGKPGQHRTDGLHDKKPAAKKAKRSKRRSKRSKPRRRVPPRPAPAPAAPSASASTGGSLAPSPSASAR